MDYGPPHPFKLTPCLIASVTYDSIFQQLHSITGSIKVNRTEGVFKKQYLVTGYLCL